MHLARIAKTIAAFLTLLAVVAMLPPTSRAGQNEQTDLQIQVIGLQPGSQRSVTIRVSNISAWWSNTTVATVQTLSPNAGNQQTFNVPDINTVAEAPLPHLYEFTYTLANDCNGDVVKATLSPGSNYAGVQETNLANNVDQQQVCPARGASASNSPSPSSSAAPSPSPSPLPSSSPLPSGFPSTSPGPIASSLPPGAIAASFQPQQVTPDTAGPPATPTTVIDQPGTANTPSSLIDAQIAADEVRRAEDGTSPGQHTATLPWDWSRRRGTEKEWHNGFGASCCAVSHGNLEPKFLIGWWEYKWYGNSCNAVSYQVAMNFTLPATGPLSMLQNYIINKVVLGYDEVEAPDPICHGVIFGAEDPDVASRCWRSCDGKPEAKPNGCVVVRIPSAEWRHDEPVGSGLFPYVSGAGSPSATQISPREWDVTEPFNWQNFPVLRPIPAPGVTLSPGFGFLLSGAFGTDDLEGHDSTSCMSWVTNVHLTITYTVPQDNGAPSPIH